MRLAGKVLDENGEPLPGVVVSIQDEGGTQLGAAVTQGDGSFAVVF